MLPDFGGREDLVLVKSLENFKNLSINAAKRTRFLAPRRYQRRRRLCTPGFLLDETLQVNNHTFARPFSPSPLPLPPQHLLKPHVLHQPTYLPKLPPHPPDPPLPPPPPLRRLHKPKRFRPSQNLQSYRIRDFQIQTRDYNTFSTYSKFLVSR